MLVHCGYGLEIKRLCDGCKGIPILSVLVGQVDSCEASGFGVGEGTLGASTYKSMIRRDYEVVILTVYKKYYDQGIECTGNIR